MAPAQELGQAIQLVEAANVAAPSATPNGSVERVDAFHCGQHERDRVLGDNNCVCTAIVGNPVRAQTGALNVEAVSAGRRQLHQLHAVLRGGDHDVDVDRADETTQVIGVHERFRQICSCDVAELDTAWAQRIRDGA